MENWWLKIGIWTIALQGKSPRVRVGVWAKVRISFRVGGNQTIAPEENCPPVRVGVKFRVSFGLGGGGQFSSGAIVLEFWKPWMKK